MWWATLLLSKSSNICLYFFLSYNGFLSLSIELKQYVPPTQKSCELEVAEKSRAQVGDISLKRTPVASSGAAAAAKSLQSCLTLCDPIDGSPPGSPIPGILQARILEWVAITVFIALLFLECHIDRIILYVAFSDWLLSLRNMHLKSPPTSHVILRPD